MNLQLFAQKKEKKMEEQRTPMPESVEKSTLSGIIGWKCRRTKHTRGNATV